MYTKVLKSRYSPENNCHVPEGEILTVVAPNKLPAKDEAYHFTGSLSDKKKSQYGWISKIDEFTLEDFLKVYAINPEDEKEQDYVKNMLESISKKPIDTPMAADFVVRGTSQKRTVLTIHKVFFYESR